MARSTSRDFLIRIEDLDGPRMKDADQITCNQLRDLTDLGLTHDGPILRQQDRSLVYEQALSRLEPLIYECYCSRKDILEASTAPHGTLPRYPGTCRNLSTHERTALRRERPPALRINASSTVVGVTDLLHGHHSDEVDDFVVRRADGVFSYTFAVVVDDGLQFVDQVVRGDDLLESAPRQAWLATQLGFTPPEYLHVPLVYSGDGTRMAKRDKAVSLGRLRKKGISTQVILNHLAQSLNLATEDESVGLDQLVDRFDPVVLPKEPWLVDPMTWA
jgi:glutamyl-tRNA synthetase